MPWIVIVTLLVLWQAVVEIFAIAPFILPAPTAVWRAFLEYRDPILHNVHSFLNGSTVINFAMPPQPGLVLTKKMDKPGGEQLKCDVHNFMTGGIFVAENPYNAMTKEDGTYEIKDVPAGNYTINYKMLDVDEVVEALRGRPERVHVICTGRNAHPKLVKLADLVTEMREVKHPYTKGILAQRGIDY